MLIDGQFMAPAVGIWKDVDDCDPDAGSVVLGIGWTKDNFPQVQFVYCEKDEDGEVTVWRHAWTHEAHCPPWMWAELKFTQYAGSDIPEPDPEWN